MIEKVWGVNCKHNCEGMTIHCRVIHHVDTLEGEIEKTTKVNANTLIIDENLKYALTFDSGVDGQTRIFTRFDEKDNVKCNRIKGIGYIALKCGEDK